MVISDKYKYLFVELPRTGTTAISKELVENYQGRSILWKHAPLNKFLEQATGEQRKYFIFACIRNPVDRTFSLYNKIKHDHGGEFSILKYRRFKNLQAWYFYSQYLYIKENNASFVDYLKRFYSVIPYDDWASLNHSAFNSVIRFEYLNEDFKRTLRGIGIEVKRDLPLENVTQKNSKLSNEIDSSDSKLINKIFAVYIEKMGLEFPDGYRKLKVSLGMKLKYNLFHFLRSFYWRFIKKAKFANDER